MTTNISTPGIDWRMRWASGVFEDFQLDIVGFLAVLGEGSVLANFQVSALSPLFFLPRIIPAPQALLPPERKKTLPETKAWVTGVFSGNTKEHVHHVAHVLLGQELAPFTVRCVRVMKQNQQAPSKLTKMATSFLPMSTSKTSTPLVTAALKGPLAYVTLLGCFLSIALFVTSFVLGDGMSLLATILLSFLSTLTGFANKWDIELPRRANDNAPPGDTVIRYPNGSYLIVRCEEEVARELYFAPEEIKYFVSKPWAYRIISLVGTIILMGGIIALANAKLQLQIAWAGAYVIINAAYWIVAALPQRLHWDLSCYRISEEGVEGGPYNTNFTEALWKAILLTKDTRWVTNGHAAPQTHVWDLWLKEAQKKSREVGAEDKDVPLDEPIYPDKEPRNGKMWKQPRGPDKKEAWDPKKAWNKINESEESEKEAAGTTVRAKTY